MVSSRGLGDVYKRQGLVGFVCGLNGCHGLGELRGVVCLVWNERAAGQCRDQHDPRDEGEAPVLHVRLPPIPRWILTSSFGPGTDRLPFEYCTDHSAVEQKIDHLSGHCLTNCCDLPFCLRITCV